MDSHEAMSFAIKGATSFNALIDFTAVVRRPVPARRLLDRSAHLCPNSGATRGGGGVAFLTTEVFVATVSQ
eukprot:385546-Pyramimonas_sp.AAC.1